MSTEPKNDTRNWILDKMETLIIQHPESSSENAKIKACIK
jgi:hypothetical protein